MSTAEVNNDPRLVAALAAIDGLLASTTDDKQQLVLWKCSGLIRGYHARWKDAPYEVDQVEQFVSADLWNPTSGRKSRSFLLAGKLDSTGYSGRRVLVDHKTTSCDITDPNAPYWRQLIIEGQVSHYMLLEWMNGRKVDEAMWDVMRKPGISPKALTKKDYEETRFSGKYFGYVITRQDADELCATGRENGPMYAARVAWDCTENRPEWYFQRKTIQRIDKDLHEYASDLWDISQDILVTRREDRWTRNSGACMLYGSPCKFLGICSGFDAPESDNWKKKLFVHNELEGIEGDGRNILTNSRVRCFQTCRRKHFYEYELGIDRQDEEEKEALIFGTTWHTVLEAWFNASKQQQGENNVNTSSTTSPASAVGADGSGISEEIRYF